MSVFARLRQPEYVGENRCLPCTAVNVGIAAAVGVVVGTWTLAAGVAAFAACLCVIYLRGYLVPGTPQLTKRYVPDRVLRWFDKAPSNAAVTTTAEDGDGTEGAFDPEALLSKAGAIGPCETGDDLCLRPAFKAAWHDRIEAVREGDSNQGSTALKRTLWADDDDRRPEVKRVDGDVVAIEDNAVIGRWVSHAAVLADVAAADVLPDRLPRWETLAPNERTALLATLRLFLETCPGCGGSVELTRAEVEGCCRSVDVVRTVCSDCDARLCEFEWN